MSNITHIRDDAQQTIFFRSRRIKPSADCTYDAIYRLIAATGREHLGQIRAPSEFDSFHTGLEQPDDGNAMGTYAEAYVYDAVGNILAMQHRGSDAAHSGCTRSYKYNEPSQLEPSMTNNRLSSTKIGTTAETYRYEGSASLHGNMTAMAHLPLMQWNAKDQLHAVSRQVVKNGGMPELTWYVYDSEGQRVRKTTERQTAADGVPTRLRERIYVDSFEVYREYSGDGNTVVLERESLHIIPDKQAIALVETRTQGEELGEPGQLIRYQFDNHLGSVSLELDSEAQIISYEEFYPYGGTSYQALNKRIKAAAKRYRYMGKEGDKETGLYYYGARLGDGLDLYAFTKNNPVGIIDPDGKQGTPSNAHSNNDEIPKQPHTLDETLQYLQDHPTNPCKVSNHHNNPPDRAEELATFFSSNVFNQEAVGSDTASQRLTRVLDATEHAIVPGLKTGGVVSGWHDEGFSSLFKDPHPSSDNQVGHFLTTINLGANPNFVDQKSTLISTTFNALNGMTYGAGYVSPPLQRFETVRDVLSAPASMSSTDLAIRLIVGHEKEPDSKNPLNFITQYQAATAQDVEVFKRALGPGCSCIVVLRSRFSMATKITPALPWIQPRRVNSYQDLLLSLVGWRLGQDIASGKIKDRQQVAAWVRTNLK